MKWLFWVVTCLSMTSSAQQKPLVLFDFELKYPHQIKANDAIFEHVKNQLGHGLQITSQASQKWPGVRLTPAHKPWDFQSYREVAVDVTNNSNTEIELFLRVDSSKRQQTQATPIAANSSATLTLLLSETPWVLDREFKFHGMFKAPHKTKIDLGAVSGMTIFLNQPKHAAKYTIDKVSLRGQLTKLKTASFLPFIDKFGQFKHSQWPGKINSIGDLKAIKAFEANELKTKLTPNNWNKYGAWLKAPKQDATGHFRVQKINDKWWIIDPDGYLFWSSGVTCVTSSAITALTDREKYFSDLPGNRESESQFYEKQWWAVHGYYKNKTPFKTFDFLKANLFRKHGSSWREDSQRLIHKRLRSWGINTMGNWSDKEIMLNNKTVFTVPININAATLEASKGYWGKFHDVFDPSFRSEIKKELSKIKFAVDNPWCLGVFVDNELAWGEETTLALATLQCASTQASKKVFIAGLKEKYKTINHLNDVWQSNYASWQILLESTVLPKTEFAREDLIAFTQKIATTYFKTIKEEISMIAPKLLYLGCRFAETNTIAEKAAAKYCDIVSFNKYEYNLNDLQLPKGVDKPMIIGEFHFGAQDRGVFNNGLRQAKDQKQRALRYKEYIRSALAHNQIVGTHWFQYVDQPTSGRIDGENHQVGFISISDSPYPELIKASQEVNYSLYEYRSKP